MEKGGDSNMVKTLLTFLLLTTTALAQLGQRPGFSGGMGGAGFSVQQSTFKLSDVTWKLLLYDTVGVFSDAGTTPITEGGAVQQWNDQSGNSNHLTAANAAHRGTWYSGSGIKFDGSDDRMVPTAAVHSSTSSYSVYVVFSDTSFYANQTLFDALTGRFRIRLRNGGTDIGFFDGGNKSFVSAATAGKQILTIVFSDSARLYRGNIHIGSTTYTPNAISGTTFFFLDLGSTTGFGGRVRFIGIAATEHNATTRTNVYNALKTMYGNY